MIVALAAGEETPEGDEQLAGEGHDHDALDASGCGDDAGLEPAREGAVGLPLKPEPGELDGGMPCPSVAGLADALLAMGGATGEGGRIETAKGGELATVVEVAIEDLVLQDAGDFRADGTQFLKMEDAAERAGRIDEIGRAHV